MLDIMSDGLLVFLGMAGETLSQATETVIPFAPVLQNLSWPAALVIVAWMLTRTTKKRSPLVRCILAITQSLKTLEKIVPVLEEIACELRKARTGINEDDENSETET